MISTSDLLAYWKLLSTDHPPFIHPEDRIPDELRIELPVSAGVDYPDDAGYENSNNRNRYHINLLPVPYAGDLVNATVIVLLLNPGCSPLDYVAESVSEFRDAVAGQLAQSFLPGVRRFFCLRQEFSWTGAGQWWRSKLLPVVQQFTDRGTSVPAALDRISSRFAVLEYWPYHSIDAHLPRSMLKHSRSHSIISEYARGELSQRARSGDCLIIVPRAVKRWGVPEQRNVIIYDRGASRGASLAAHADRIYKYLA